MAENEDGQERSEQPTPKRLREAAERGQVARSRELNTLALLLFGVAGLLALGPSLLEHLLRQMRASFSVDGRLLGEPSLLLVAFQEAIGSALMALLPLLALLFVVALLAPMALGGWSFSTKALELKWDRLDPIKGLGRMFSRRALVELAKALGKFIVVAVAAVWLLRELQPDLLRLGTLPLLPALDQAADQIGWSLLVLVVPLILIAGIDVPFQLSEHMRQLKMTLREVKDEMKDTEGRPEVRGRIRRLQQEMSQRRMMERLPEADVVVTNPTHYAVALQYRQDGMAAPVVVAMGVDLVALNIRSIAASHAIPQVESRRLARALYYHGELEQPIPGELYVAVAQVLAYVYQLRAEGNVADGEIVMNDVPVPADLRQE